MPEATWTATGFVITGGLERSPAMPERYCFESCAQEQAIAEPIEGDGDMTFYWVRTKLGTIDRWSERDYWSDVEFVRPVTTDECSQTHQQRHEMLHKHFDELVADFLRWRPDAYPSKATLLDLMQWSNGETKAPTEERVSQ